ncbi:uncharacterized protein LOC116026957 [Ipomoea triloba]|uniref:uncharacterized protein LOC116026957 n=1 Tax=Ipomoea triloba TaxID=35885 RepID=UPI00125E4EEC|nr:uncharacterized protein LOC116026957 [Ipomoea triloba]
MEVKHLSAIANDVVRQCAQKLDTSVDALVAESEGGGYEADVKVYSRKIVEVCCSKALTGIFSYPDNCILDDSFSRFTFNMMLAWEMPSLEHEGLYAESLVKELEDTNKEAIKMSHEHDDIALFYSDIMPLLVDDSSCVGEDSFVWLAALVPVVADVVNARSTFEILTASTGSRLHFPAYDVFLKEIDKCVRHLQKQVVPTGMELVDDEFILHVEGTATSQRVVRHIGGTSWPGRLTLTNYALYFEASGILSYEDALKLDLSKDVQKSVKPTVTGPWGAPLFDKAIVYQSSEMQEGVVLEFPEMTSSTRRDHWLALIKEIMLLHQFLLMFNIKSPVQSWGMHARTILGIIRLHAAREMLRLSPPIPKSFLILDLIDELPKGEHLLQELCESLKKTDTRHPCSSSSILRTINVPQLSVPATEVKEIDNKGTLLVQSQNASPLASAIEQSREEEKEIDMAKATAREVKEEGLGDSFQVFICLLQPLRDLKLRVWKIFTWERPVTTSIVAVTTLLVIYKEWVGKAISAFLLWMVATMLMARRSRNPYKNNKVVVYTEPQTTMQCIVSLQQGIRTVYDMIQCLNVIILKIWSVMVSHTPKHAYVVMIAMTIAAIVLALIPFKFVLMALTLYSFMATLMVAKERQNQRGNRRLQEWWDSIPVIPVELVQDKAMETSILNDLDWY